MRAKSVHVRIRRVVALSTQRGEARNLSEAIAAALQARLWGGSDARNGGAADAVAQTIAPAVAAALTRRSTDGGAS